MGFLAKFVDDQAKAVNPVHIITLLLVLAICIWGTWVVLHTNGMPDLHGAAELIGGTGLANIAHKAEDIVGMFKKTEATTPPPPPMAPPA